MHVSMPRCRRERFCAARSKGLAGRVSGSGRHAKQVRHLPKRAIAWARRRGRRPEKTGFFCPAGFYVPVAGTWPLGRLKSTEMSLTCLLNASVKHHVPHALGNPGIGFERRMGAVR